MAPLFLHNNPICSSPFLRCNVSRLAAAVLYTVPLLRPATLSPLQLTQKLQSTTDIMMLSKPAFNLSPFLSKNLLTRKNPFFIPNYTSYNPICSMKPSNTIPISLLAFKTKRLSQKFSTATAPAISSTVTDYRGAPINKKNSGTSNQQGDSRGSKSRRKAYYESPSGLLLRQLNICSKENNLEEALRLYDDALIKNISLTVEHYNKLLYLCSSNNTDLGLKRGFEIYKQMGGGNNNNNKVVPNEATFTTMARLATAKEDLEMAFGLVKRMKEESGIPPKLRSCLPALCGFCKKGMADKAYEVDSYMIENGILPEEAELLLLLGVSSDSNRVDKVYEMLQRLRARVRQVSEETAAVIEDWFRSENAATVGQMNWDVTKVREGVLNGGGGWHGQGWLGSGKWQVVRTEMDGTGVCQSCGEKLVGIDIDPLETENFASSLSTLAFQKEARFNFLNFQEWLQKHGPFDVVIDGANVGHLLQNYFSFDQLKLVVNSSRKLSPSGRLPLVVLHRSRVKGGPAEIPKNKRLLQCWKDSGALYVTPAGSNDDWYWLYAAIDSKCLLVTNDEMRDHLFQLLGTSFFSRWKEKHQVRMTNTIKDGFKLHMPPPYSIVIQESEQGSWHIPTVTGDDLEARRQWVCVTRTKP